MKRIFAIILLMAAAVTSASAAGPKIISPNSVNERIQEMQSRFDALTEEEKEELLTASDSIRESIAQLIDRYGELGILTEDEADELSSRVRSKGEDVRQKEQFPGFVPPNRAENRQPA